MSDSTPPRRSLTPRGLLAPYVLLTFTMLFWSASPVIANWLKDSMPPVSINFARWIISLVLLAPFTLRELIDRRTVLLRHWKLLAVLGFTGAAGFHTLLYWALHWTTVSNNALIQSILPLGIMSLSWLLFRDRIGKRQAAGMSSSFLGVLVILCRGDLGVLLSLSFNPGDLLVVAAIFLWSLYAVLLRLRPPELSQLALLEAITLYTVIELIPVVAAEELWGTAVVWSWKVAAGAAYLGVFAAALANLFWNEASHRIGPNRAAPFVHLLPMFSLLLGVGLVGERLHPYHAPAIILILGGIALASAPRLWGRRGVRPAPLASSKAGG
jgi:drug/metabolite transporter (DMT)-like permease